jgi:hypothetical protein
MVERILGTVIVLFHLIVRSRDGKAKRIDGDFPGVLYD